MGIHTTNINKAGYIPELDGLRAVAVLLVILFHLELDSVSGGFIGVDIFFVISGYLITRNIQTSIELGRFSFADFYVSRIRRLIPALLATIILCLLVGFIVFSPDALIRLSGSSIAGILSLANIRFWNTSGYFDVDAVLKPLLHLWSLSVEEQFYLVWPIMLWILLTKIGNSATRLTVIVVFLFLSLISSEYLTYTEPSTAFFWMPLRAYEFLIGAILFFYEKGAPLIDGSKSSVVFSLVGVLLVLFPAITFNDLTRFPGAAALLPCLGTALIIRYRSARLVTQILSNPVSIFVGRISYSLYLGHWPVWVFSTFLIGYNLDILDKAVIFCIMILVGILLYFLVEQRFRKKPDSKSEVSFLTKIFGLCIFIILVSLITRINLGWPQRMGPEQFDIPHQKNIHCEDTEFSRLCRFGKSEDAQFDGLLVGDSHSLNLIVGLNEFGIRNNMAFSSISRGGCPPLVNTLLYAESSVAPDKSCLRHNEYLEKRLRTDHYDFVLIAARWGWLIEHGKYYVGQNPPKGFILMNQFEEKTVDSSRKNWELSLIKTLELIRARDKKVVLFSQYPLLQRGIGECDKSPFWLFNSSEIESRCEVAIPYEQIMQRLSYMNGFLQSVQAPGSLVLIPSDYLCDSLLQYCDAMAPEGLLYNDDNHLSNLGSLKFIEMIEQRLLEFIE